MCGLFSVLSRHDSISKDYSPLLKFINHRGPNDSGSSLVSLADGRGQHEARAWMGHTRLSILDLSPRGRQPMESTDGRYVVVFNGEIYNYIELRTELIAVGGSFRTDTDTEVLLQAWAMWGEACLLRLKGMFAFVLVDRINQTATLVRDFFGIKPLYFAECEDRLIICSEIFPILQTREVSTDLEPDLVYEYLRFGSTNSNVKTLLRQVRALPPAHLTVFDFKSGKLADARCYWELKTTESVIPFPDAVAECRERFLDNVRLHLRSDVPVGAALSGGIDSSAVVCAMSLLEPELDLQTFSYIADSRSYSEEKWVDIVHAHAGGVCHKIRPSSTELAADLRTLILRQGEPFGSASCYAQFRVFQRARQEGVTVTLDGQGADELLGGYWPYVGTRATELLRNADLVGCMRMVLNAVPGYSGMMLMSSMLLQSFLPPQLRNLARQLSGREFFPKYLNKDWFRNRNVDFDALADELVGRYRTMKEHLVGTVEHGSLPNLLRYADRSSMAHSVESRVPFLTPDFAEFLLSLPADYLISATGVRKHVFREAMKGILPEEIRLRSDKIGFFADDGLWLRQNASLFEELWDELSREPMFCREKFSEFIAEFYNGRHEKAQLVWRAMIFGMWLREVRLAAR